MKKYIRFGELESHYTTKAQAKELLEIGLPANSADLYADENGIIHFINDDDQFREEFFEHYGNGYEPRWTDGRLIEIYCLVTHLIFPGLDGIYTTKDIISEILYKTKQGTDFSKLEK